MKMGSLFFIIGIFTGSITNFLKMKLYTTLLFFTLFAAGLFAQSNKWTTLEELTLTLPEHEALALFEGEWDVQIEFFFDKDDGKALKGAGDSKNQVVLGGRFIESRSQNIAFGMSITSIAYLGYDVRLQKYTLYSMDELGNFAINAYGDFKKSDNKFIFEGNTMDYVTREDQMFRIIYDFEGEDLIKYEVDFLLPDGSYKPYINAEFRRKQ
ncbi:MAG: DUF1579 family protein [Ignavibacteriales bacterium]|nr:DUF1579 family protein [Ignavibacteriales bacterium]